MPDTVESSHPIGLYIHIPFCRMKCFYCDFAVYPGLGKETNRYLHVLDLELKTYQGTKIDTIYFGGGTPSLLSTEQWNGLMHSLHFRLDLSSCAESTVECNPKGLCKEKLKLFQNLGIHRLSFGLQVIQDKHLKKIGRLYRFEDFKNVFICARSLGFKNLNVDLIPGIPGQTMDEFKETLTEVLRFRPEHLSLYTLTIEEKTAFFSRKIEVDSDLQSEMMEWASCFLEEEGWVHYEISNFALPGYECKHNLRYWKNQPTLGAGCAAASFLKGVRTKNTERFYDYMRAVEEGKSPVIEKVCLDEPQKAGEDLMLGLRLKNGIRISPGIQKWYGKTIQKFVSSGFLIQEQDRVFATPRGWMFSNQMFQEFLEPNEI